MTRKNLLLILSLVLIVIGIVILIPSISYWLRLLTIREINDLADVVLNVVRTLIGLLADVLGLVLGISSLLKKEPPALVTIPQTAKLRLDLTLIGRDGDLAWLQGVGSDSLLVGQPGSGKTFLLIKFAKEGHGLFVEGDDISQIAIELKKKRPEVMIIDDAQLHVDLLNRLKQLRHKKKVDFRIVASCWPSHQERIAEILNLPQNRIHNLDLLTMDQIVQVVEDVGLKGPDGLIREIVNQSAGRPGLAVTLTDICLSGGVREVVLGDILTRSVSKYLSELVSDQAIIVLAGFALGGDSGMPITIVAQELRVSLPEVQSIVTRAASGLMLENRQCLAVYPPALRHALVRDKFFCGAASLPRRPFIEQAPSLTDVAETLIGAKARGAIMPWDFLLDILQQVDSSKLWEELAYLGRDEAIWVLKNRPEYLVQIASPALIHTPEIAIPLLLERTIGDERQLHSTPEHPLRLIQDWVFSAYPGRGIAIPRRIKLFDAVVAWIKSGAAPDMGYRALQIALSPEFHNVSEDPGSGSRITLHYGHLTLDEIKSFQSLWTQALLLISQFPPTNWLAIREIIETWAYPGRLHSVTIDVAEVMKSTARNMLRDVLPMISNSPGLLHWAHHLSERASLNVEINTDECFEILYPEGDFKNLRESEAQQVDAVRKLAEVWSLKNPKDSVQEIRRYESEAQVAGAHWPRWTPVLCNEIARRVESPLDWLKQGIKADLAGDLVVPFLARGIEIAAPNWIKLARKCLLAPHLKYSVIHLALVTLNLPETFLEDVFSNLVGAEQIIEMCCLRNEIPEDRVSRLLKHENRHIARAAAVGEWLANSRKVVRESLRKQWEDVIVNNIPDNSYDVTDSYYLEEIFVTYPDLAFSWLINLLQKVKSDPNFDYGLRFEDVLRSAASVLDVKRRKTILDSLSPSHLADALILPLIGDSNELYQRLLARSELKGLHLVPLYGSPSEMWANKAIIAMEAGYSPKDIVYATRYGLYHGVSWIGNESDMWSGWMEQLEPYLLHDDNRIREVAKSAIEYAQQKRDQALAEKRHEAIYGR